MEIGEHFRFKQIFTMNSLPSGQVRWGICSAGKISNDFCAALALLPKSEHQIAAVAARNIESAQEFAKTFEIPRVYGSYEELAKDQQLGNHLY